MRSEQPKIITKEDGSKWVWCSFHKDYSPIEGFGVIKDTTQPRSMCRKCEAYKQKLRNQKDYFYIKKSDAELAYEILTSLGYELDSQKPLHTQFCEKHNLQEKNKVKK